MAEMAFLVRVVVIVEKGRVVQRRPSEGVPVRRNRAVDATLRRAWRDLGDFHIGIAARGALLRAAGTGRYLGSSHDCGIMCR